MDWGADFWEFVVVDTRQGGGEIALKSIPVTLRSLSLPPSPSLSLPLPPSSLGKKEKK